MNALEQYRAIRARSTSDVVDSVLPEPKDVKESFYHSSEELEEYRRSDRWQELRLARLEFDGRRCLLCNGVANTVHHVCYPEELGTESVEEDLRSMCGDCHYRHHADSIKLRKLKERFLRLVPKGLNCWLCGKWNHVDSRPLNWKMAISLLWIVREYESNGEEWVYCPDGPQWFQRTKQHPTLKHWGLIERPAKNADSEQNPKKKHSGFWRPTEKGIQFAQGRISVPERALIYKDECLGFEGEDVLIHGPLPPGFDYEKIMNFDGTTTDWLEGVLLHKEREKKMKKLKKAQNASTTDT